MLPLKMKTALSALGRRTAPPPISWLMKTALGAAQTHFTGRRFHGQRHAARRKFPAGCSTGFCARPRPASRRCNTASPPAKIQSARSSPPRICKSWTADTTAAHTPERVIITGGSQQLLYMTLEALCDEGDIVLVEDPTYFVFLGILQSRGIKARGVQLERDGH